MIEYLELRWFFEGIIPDEVSQWEKDLGQKGRKEAEQIDLYLLFPSTGLGVKLSRGELEIKYLISDEEFHSDDNEISGKMETWNKSSLLLKDSSANPFQNVEGSQVVVDKGFFMEVTKLTIEGIHWWTLAFDTLGELQKEFLKHGIINVLKDYPGPKLQQKNSFSYPQWISIIYNQKHEKV